MTTELLANATAGDGTFRLSPAIAGSWYVGPLVAMVPVG